MSILVKGMKKPKNCDECPLADSYLACGAQSINCPLIEVPTPHGRLIDADALYKTYQEICSDIACISCPFLKEDRCEVEQMIMYEPTIIEAEEGEEECVGS